MVKNDKIVSSKYIEVTKNRFDGELGKFSIRFEKDILSFVPVSHKKSFRNEILDIHEVDFSDINVKQ